MSDALRGRFVWYELLTSDPDAAIDFYTRLIGWSSAPFDVSGQEYTMWMKGEVPVGGVMQLPEEAVAGGAPPHWLAYLGTSDVEPRTTRPPSTSTPSCSAGRSRKR
ncbi:MAG: VOC family protein [Gemmatimonadales bacterium]